MLNLTQVLADARFAPRVDCSIPGVIIADDLNLKCTIRDISILGCRISFQSDAVLPDTFRFMFIGHEISLEAKLTWQNGQEAGVQFIQNTEQAAPGNQTPQL